METKGQILLRECRKAIGIFLSLALCLVAESKELLSVPIGITEALSATDSTSSQRYRERFEAAVHFAIGENEGRLNRCGYRYLLVPKYFDSSNKEAPAQIGEELARSEVWSAFGPRRSEDFLGVASTLKETLFITPMANSHDVTERGSPLYTMYPSTANFSKGIVRALIKEKYGKRYASIVDVTCPACKDLDSEFGNVPGFERAFTFDIASDEPLIDGLIVELRKAEAVKKLDFLFLPNNSRASGFVISRLQKDFPHLKYVGAHGWGDANYGFLFAYGIDKPVQGFCVRAGREFSQMADAHRVHSIDYVWKGTRIGPNYTAFAAVHYIRRLTDLLCAHRPKGREELLKKVRALKGNPFLFSEPLSVYRLSESKLQFGYTLE